MIWNSTLATLRKCAILIPCNSRLLGIPTRHVRRQMPSSQAILYVSVPSLVSGAHRVVELLGPWFQCCPSTNLPRQLGQCLDNRRM